MLVPWCGVGHAGGMAIQMKEWGMLPYPGRGVHVPAQGIGGWGAAVADAARGAQSVVQGAAMQGARDKVASAGDLAGFYGRLQEVVAEAGEEMEARGEVKDWDYAWDNVCTPLVNRALQDLPEESRGAARELAAAYTARAALERRRDAELERISQSRAQWRGQLERAVQDGDEVSARLWLQQGRDVFVPAAEMEDMERCVQSGAALARWNSRLQQDPLAALGELAGESADLPGRQEDRARLQETAEDMRRTLRARAAGQLAEDVMAQRETPADWVEQATAAGVLTAEQGRAMRQPRRALPAAERCDWQRRIDERSGDDDDALRLEICTAAMPRAEQQRLLQRMQAGAGVPAEERRGLSRRLWGLYGSGCFGTPGDALACRRMDELQQDALALLAGGDRRALDSWLQDCSSREERWICYGA